MGGEVLERWESWICSFIGRIGVHRQRPCSTIQLSAPLIWKPSSVFLNTSDSFTSSDRDSDQRPGIVYGLVVMGQGKGGILPVETILLPGGNGRLKLTGSLGEVIKESGLALSWVKRHAWELVEKRIGDPLRDFPNGGRTIGEGKKKDDHGIESDLDTNGGQG